MPHPIARIALNTPLRALFDYQCLDFPVEVGISGDLKTTDYRKALQEVRQWIGEHRGDYELLTEVY